MNAEPQAEICNRCLKNDQYYIFKMDNEEYEARCSYCAMRTHIFKQVEK